MAHIHCAHPILNGASLNLLLSSYGHAFAKALPPTEGDLSPNSWGIPGVSTPCTDVQILAFQLPQPLPCSITIDW